MGLTERHIFVARANAVTGSDAEFNEWYTGQHMHDVLAVPGFVSAQRFRLGEVQRAEIPPDEPRYVAIYEIDGDLGQAVEQLGEATARMFISPSLVRPTHGRFYTAVTERVTR